MKDISAAFGKQFDSLKSHTVELVDDPRAEISAIGERSLKVCVYCLTW